jgi:hypothetical protein
LGSRDDPLHRAETVREHAPCALRAVDPPVQRVVAHDTTAAERGAPCGLERWAVERTCLGPEVADGTKDLRLFSALAPTKDAVARMPVKDAIAWAIFAEVRRNLKLFLLLRPGAGE